MRSKSSWHTSTGVPTTFTASWEGGHVNERRGSLSDDDHTGTYLVPYYVSQRILIVLKVYDLVNDARMGAQHR